MTQQEWNDLAFGWCIAQPSPDSYTFTIAALKGFVGDVVELHQSEEGADRDTRD